jgi:hypothetical protein
MHRPCMHRRSLSVCQREIRQLETNGRDVRENYTLLFTSATDKACPLSMYRPMPFHKRGVVVLTARHLESTGIAWHLRGRTHGLSWPDTLILGWKPIKTEPPASFGNWFPVSCPVSTCDNVVQALPSRGCSQPRFNHRQSYGRARSSLRPQCGDHGIVCPGPLPTSWCACQQGPTRFHCWQSQFGFRAVGECIYGHDERSSRVLVPRT